MTTIQTVREQYESLPYPPRDPARELEKLRSTRMGELGLANHILWGGRRLMDKTFRVLDAGCGTGDNAIFMAVQLQGTGAHVVGVDLSDVSLDVARRRAEARGLDNLTLIRGQIEELPSLGLEPFDYAVSIGVLHHLPSPVVGLAAIRNVLKPGGGIGIMVYGSYGRTAIYQVQTLLKILAPDSLPAEERIRIARSVVRRLRPEHWATFGKGSWAGEVDLHGDAGLFDVFLHPTDRAYTVPELYAWLAAGGIRMVRFLMPSLYDPGLYSDSLDVSALSEAERHAVAELLNGRIQKHTFFALAEDAPSAAPPALDDETAVPTWLSYDADGLIGRQLNDRPALDLELEEMRFTFTLDSFRRAFLKSVDGKTSLGAILAEMATKFPRMTPGDRLSRWKDIYLGLDLFNLFGLVPAMP